MAFAIAGFTYPSLCKCVAVLVATGCDDVYSAMCALMVADGVQLPAKCAYDELGIDHSVLWQEDPELAQSFEGDVAILSTLQM